MRRGGHAVFNTKTQRLRHTSHGVTMAAMPASYAGESIAAAVIIEVSCDASCMGWGEKILCTPSHRYLRDVGSPGPWDVCD